MRFHSPPVATTVTVTVFQPPSSSQRQLGPQRRKAPQNRETQWYLLSLVLFTQIFALAFLQSSSACGLHITKRLSSRFLWNQRPRSSSWWVETPPAFAGDAWAPVLSSGGTDISTPPCSPGSTRGVRRHGLGDWADSSPIPQRMLRRSELTCQGLAAAGHPRCGTRLPRGPRIPGGRAVPYSFCAMSCMVTSTRP